MKRVTDYQPACSWALFSRECFLGLDLAGNFDGKVDGEGSAGIPGLSSTVRLSQRMVPPYLATIP